MKKFLKFLHKIAVVYCLLNAAIATIYYQEASSGKDLKVVEILRELRPLNGFQIFADMAGYENYGPPTQFTRYFPVLFLLTAFILYAQPKRRKKLKDQKATQLQWQVEDTKNRNKIAQREHEERLKRNDEAWRKEQLKKSDQVVPEHKKTTKEKVKEPPKKQEMAEDLTSWFFGEYLPSHEGMYLDLGDMNLPYNNGVRPVVKGREDLINSNLSLGKTSAKETRALVLSAAEYFDDACVAVDPQEFEGDVFAGRANARMWLGITQSILGNDASTLDEPQKRGAGLAFAESTSKFLVMQDFRMVGRVTQEWAESLIYAGLFEDANTLFMISVLVFNSFDEKDRAQTVLNRSANTAPSNIDSSFLARRLIPGSEAMTSILGCRNTTDLRKTCISAK